MTDSEKLDLILSGMNEMKTDIQNLKADVQRLETNMQLMQADIVEIRQRVTKNELITENELRVNIQRVAEGHLDLSRKLDECIRLSSETRDRREMQDLYINMHDTKLKTL